MTTKQPGANMRYIIGVSVLSFVLPIISVIVEFLIGDMGPLALSLGKWFLFYAAGIRLLIAGIRQVFNPAFTSREIFHINSTDVLPIVRELGFANFCTGLIAIIAILCPAWREPSAVCSGLYFGIAGIYHFIKKPAGANERFAMITDILIFLLLMAYVAVMHL